MPRRRRPNPATIQTSSPPVSPPTSPTGVVDLTYYEVEKIFRKSSFIFSFRHVYNYEGTKAVQYFAKFVGYDEDSNLWIDAETARCNEVIAEFEIDDRRQRAT
ncbi:Uncharacterized protein APZ42_005396, partial [Daphnia magna]